MRDSTAAGIPLACADFSFPLVSHELALDLIARLDIGAVDISLMVGYSHLDIEQSIRRPAEAGAALAAKLSSRGLLAADVNFAPGADFETLAINHPEPAVRSESAEWFRRALEFAAHVGCRHLTVLPGVHWPNEGQAESYARCVDELAWRLEYAAGLGITMAIEAHLGSIVPTPDSTQELLRAVPDLTLTLDYTHFVYQGFTQSACDVLLPHASHFHARGGAPKRLQTSLKNSAIDYPLVIQKMRECKYPGYFAIEYVWIDWEGCNETDNLSETVLMRDLARKLLGS